MLKRCLKNCRQSGQEKGQEGEKSKKTRMAIAKLFALNANTIRIKQILLEQDAQLLLICFLDVIKKIAVQYAFLIIDDKVLSLLLYS